MARQIYTRKRKMRKAEGRASQHFIHAEAAQHEHAEAGSFFLPAGGIMQAKLNVSQPGDARELEADRMADKVVSRKGNDEQIERKADDTVSRKAQPIHASRAISSAVPKSGGESLPSATSAEMSSSFGYDFSNVRIHKSEQAHQLAEQLQAQAFTYRGDVYFNKDKYNPESETGKWLLAHELTHVVQQNSSHGNVVQKKDVAGFTAPIPEDFKVIRNKDGDQSARGKVKGIKVTFLPDKRGPVPPGFSAVTETGFTKEAPNATLQNGKITEIDGKAIVTITVQTTYGPKATPEANSGYGRGTTKADIKAKNTKLKFHEGQHGLKVLAYLEAHPMPEFGGKVGMTNAEFNEAGIKFFAAVDAYQEKMNAEDIQDVDCVGTLASFCEK